MEPICRSYQNIEEVQNMQPNNYHMVPVMCTDES
uniref:Uncharacterized protein n=1 Tax=Arundo donax TaxID=35708 RepID=A0A0A9HIA6_ARUDO